MLTLVYPARDAEIGRRLIVDLDNVLGQLCQLKSVACPPSFKLRLDLAPDYDRLLALKDNYQRINPGESAAARWAWHCRRQL